MSLKISIVLSIFALFFLCCAITLTLTSYAQSEIQTTKHRNMVIDLGNGLETNARLNVPAVGDGPFPGVLLVPGSGITDMNTTAGGFVRIDNETGALVYPPARTFFEIAQYLSERGFAVLQYDKRGVGANFTILDSNVWGNITVGNLIQDAQRALDVLMQQPEVDPNKISLIGHSEGTTIVPRIAINNSDKVDSIVLMGTRAQNFQELGNYQSMVPVRYAQEVLDHDSNGLISLKEASKDPVFKSLVGDPNLFVTNNMSAVNGTDKLVDKQYDKNNDTLISINDELKPRLIDQLKSLSVVTPGKKCNYLEESCPIWVRSGYSLEPNLDIISKVSPNTSVLIQQGENDSQTPLQEAFLLQQKLTELRHPDHTLVTYPDLGHLFYPSSKWVTNVGGPMERKVLEDLFEWISDPVRDLK